MTSGDLGRMNRTRRTAATWVRKSAATILWCASQARTVEQRWLLGYESAELMTTGLSEFETLVSLLPEDQIEDVEGHARALVSALRTARLRGKLVQVEGRTPEEAAAFIAKAQEMARG